MVLFYQNIIHGDFDKILTILTPGNGKITCIAKGARRLKSALLASSQMFCFADYLVFKGSSMYNINSAETIEVFYDLRTDFDKLRYAVHINKIVMDVTVENQNCYNIMQLLLNTLYIISKGEKDLDFVLSIFKLRLLGILGFSPKILKCINCEEKEKLTHFSLKDNGFKCINCAKQDKSALSMNFATKDAIKYVFMAPSKKIYSFDLKGDSLEEFNLISKLYFNDKLEKDYKLDLY